MQKSVQSTARTQIEAKSELAEEAARSARCKSLLNATGLALLATAVLVTGNVGAEPNGTEGDNCVAPVPAQLGNNPFDTSSYSTSSIPGEGGDCGDIGDMHNDIWFSYTFPSDGLAKVSTCSPGSFDTGLTVYEATGSCQSLNFVVSSAFAQPDDSCQPGYSENIFVVTGGTEYLVRVGGFDPEESGPGNLNLTFTPQPNPCDCPPGDPSCPSELVAANPFPIPGSIEFATDGIFAIWWDGDFAHASDTATMFSRLAAIRDDSLGELGMRDPPNPGHCLYYNIYIHHGAEDDFPNGWGNGQGTDGYCRPYLTLPDGVQLQESNTYHEGFHVFQYSADSPGFYHLDAEWYTEASAQWYMATKIPDDDVAFLEAGAILANPQLALWHAFGNGAPGDPEDWLYLVRQYGMHTLLFYLTEIRGVESGLMTEGFYNGTELLPQELLYSRIGGETF
ncbi:MAG: hypothetical protein MI919_03725, partial [Holophagales bacterium]|nr:hypothetical protein [Holophagales bacterium]